MMSNQIVQWQAGDLILGRYRVIGILGQDEFGEMYKARHLGWSVDLAVKRLKPEIVAALGGVEAVEHKAEAWVRLGLHPHVISCYYVRRVEGTPLIFTEHLAGGSLHHWIVNRRLYANGTASSLRRILDVAIQSAWGLHYAHEQGVIHQNVTPQAVMLSADGVAKVTDFGLAEPQALYAAPEQSRREAVTQATDVWGWGLSVLEMFIGERTWASGRLAAQALDHYLEAGVKEAQLPAMPSQLAQVLRRCFREQPNNRPANLQDVAIELQAIYQTLTGTAYPRSEPDTHGDSVDSLNNRAVALWDLDRQTEAAQLWERALALHPRHPESLYNRALLAWRSGSLSDSALLRQLEATRPETDDWKVDYLLSLVHLERGDLTTALALLEAMPPLAKQREDVEATLTLVRERLPNARQLLPDFGERVASMQRSASDLTSVALSPSGRYAISGGEDQTIKVWDVGTGRCVCVFRGHQGRVASVVFSPDGSSVLSGSDDKTAKLWNLASTSHVCTFDGEERVADYGGLSGTVSSLLRKLLSRSSQERRANGHRGAVGAVAFSPDGHYALSGSDDRTIKLWEIATGKCLRTFRGHAGPIVAVAFRPDGHYFASASSDQTIKYWRVATAEVVHTLWGAQQLTSLACSPDGQHLLAGDTPIKLWDLETGQLIRTLEGQEGVHSVAFSLDGRYAISGGEDQQLKLWELETGRCLRTFEGHELGIRAVALSSDGRYAVSADAKTLKLWAVNCTVPPEAAPLQLAHLNTPEAVVLSDRIYEQELAQAEMALERDNAVVAAQHIRKARALPGYQQAPEALQVWFRLYGQLPRRSLNASWEYATFERHTGGVEAIAVHPSGALALTASSDRSLKLWELSSSRCLLNFEGHRDSVTAVAFNPTGSHLLSASSDRTLKFWDVDTGECLASLEGHSRPVRAVAFTADARYALSGSDDKTLKLWDVTTGRCLRTCSDHKEAVTAVASSPDGRQFLSGSADKTLKLWNLATGRSLRSFEGHIAIVHSVAFSPDGRHALSGSADQTLKLWDVASGSCIRTLTGHAAAVQSVAFSPDGRHALSGSADQTLKLWDAASGDCVRTLTGHAAAVQSVAFSPDGRYILSGSADQTLKLWICDWELVDQAPIDWDEGAGPYLEAFLARQMPRVAALTSSRDPSEQELTLALTAQGTPTWTEEEFKQLLHRLACAGYGWLRPQGVRQQLGSRAKPAPAPAEKQRSATEFPTAFTTDIATAFPTAFADADAAARVILSVTDGVLKGQEFVFSDRTICIIGRAKDCHLQLPNDDNHKTVSRYHCLLDINPPAIRIRDLGSLHGTYVNGQIIGRRKPNQTPEEGAQLHSPGHDLDTGDEIKLGKTVFRIRIEAADVDKTSFDTAFSDDTALFDRRQAKPLPGAAAAHSLPTISGYTAIEHLHSSEFGEVYLAQHPEHQRVVLKILRPQKTVQLSAIDAFLRQIEHTRALRHPNIVQLIDSGYVNGAFFFASEDHRGGSVAELVQQRGRLSPEEAIAIGLQVLEGLHYAHTASLAFAKRTQGRVRGLVHGDLRPESLVLISSDAAPVAKIADYGLARAFDQAGLNALSPSTTTTPAFMPRQQAIDFKYAEPDVDVWAVAACLYYMLTGAPPRDFSSKDPYLVLLQTNPIPIQERNAAIPKPLAELIDLALTDNPEIHFKQAAAFKQALSSLRYP